VASAALPRFKCAQPSDKAVRTLPRVVQHTEQQLEFYFPQFPTKFGAYNSKGSGAEPSSMSPIPDELTATVLSVVQSLPRLQKAKLLLDHSLSLLEAGK
jgi:hypothetical protein